MLCKLINPELDSHEDPEDWAYLLTGPEDVRIALETFSMRTYSRPVNRYFLAMDEDPEHEPLRELFMQAINSVSKKRGTFKFKTVRSGARMRRRMRSS